MHQDKALLPHPLGGTWLSHVSGLFLQLGLPVRVLSGHASHQALRLTFPAIEVVSEPPPWQGPLKALARLLPLADENAMFLAPVDMPNLRLDAMQALIACWHDNPDIAVVAHDGQRLQPLLGIYPFGDLLHRTLDQELREGRSSWQNWLSRIPHRTVTLPAIQLLNANSRADLAALQT
ncbi:MAG: Molybdenum cofactor guanylyltransferase [Prochlorococcus marinus str. MIT 9215]|nr:MAG: Molybdenum cofactor guanylyltransferase [Prochlorococcus marinus str. MIT 9215]